MSRRFNLIFFCHATELPDIAVKERWNSFLRSHYERLGLDIEAVPEGRIRLPLNEEMFKVVEEVNPEVVSFHFGLPTPDLMDRLKKRGIGVLASATSVDEARWLEDRGCDAVIVQGLEAGGHRAMFLESEDSLLGDD
jgi:nitronate monooxygenase